MRFHAFPDLPPFQPFSKWDPKKGNQTLPWYADYHAVKHNREQDFSRARLENAFDAIAACAILLVAQFGQTAISLEVRRLLVVDGPSWAIEEMYLEGPGGAWTRLNHPSLA